MTADAHQFSFPGLTGGRLDLATWAGKPILVVNTASACGYTPQYADLQALHQAYGERGLAVIGVPSNDFGAQEPGSEAEIRQFCDSRFGVTFPMAAKQPVTGPAAHPFYRWVAEQGGDAAAPKWNFHKVLVGPDGRLAGAFPSPVGPRDPRLVQAIEAMLPPR